MQVLKIIVDHIPDATCNECLFYRKPSTLEDNTCAICEMLGIEECPLEVEENI